MHKQEENFSPGYLVNNSSTSGSNSSNSNNNIHLNIINLSSNAGQRHKKIENTITLWAGLSSAHQDKAKKIEDTVAMWAGEVVDKQGKRKVPKTSEKKEKEKKKATKLDFGLKMPDKKDKDKDKDKDKLFNMMKLPKANVTKMHSTPEIFQAGPEPPPLDPIPLRFDALKSLIDQLERLKATESVGVFRVNGHSASIQEIVRRLEGKTPSFNEVLPGEGINEFAGALKQYLRDAPDPMIPFQDLRKFLDVIDVPDPLLRQFALNKAVSELREENQKMLRELSLFLRRVADNSEHNRMDIKNLTISFGSCVIRPREFDFKIIGRCYEIFSLLLTYSIELFGQETDFFDDQIQICSLGRRRAYPPRKYSLHIPDSQDEYAPQVGEETRRLLHGN